MTTSGEITLEHILDFLSIDKEPQKINVHPTLTGGLGIDDRESLLSKARESHSVCRSLPDVNYYKKYQEEEEKLATQSFQQSLFRQTIDVPGAGTMLVGHLSQIEELNSICTELPEVNGLNDEDSAELYLKYITPGHSYDPNLVITPFKEKIIRMIEINQVVIIQGSTGSGKTTQVPQYILDHYAAKQQFCNIIVTQPRRIAAMSVARRVCQERQWQLGSLAGYQVALDGVTSHETRLTYVTTGVLLHKLINNRRMDMYTHVIIDEVHERDQDTDFTLLVVRRLLRSNSRTVKVILMSATFDTAKFAEYFSIPVRGKLEPAPVFEIPGKMKNVAEYYLNDLRSLGALPEIDPCTPCIGLLAYTLVYKLLKVFDTIDAREQEFESEGLAPYRGAVLIFLPGYEEISKMRDTIRDDLTTRRWWVIPLHSTITSEEQSQVFNKPQNGYRKIIMSTNIAESSITVPDIKYVIDFCLTKNLVSDPETNYTSLQLDWASKANCAQRKGRAGRVFEGRCYRMVPLEFYTSYLSEFGIPEMTRSPLEQLVLMSKKLEMGEPKSILALAIDPPALNGIERAVLVLKEVGALSVTANGYPTQHDGDLTFVGEVLSQLPLDVKVGKLILLGYACGCLQETLIIAASLSLKDFFSKPFQKFLEAYKSRLAWAHGSFSDCMAYLYAYKVWEAKAQSGQFRPPNARQKEEEWGRKNFIQIKKIKEVRMLVEELTKRLEKFNIEVEPCDPHFTAEHILILKLIIAGAFYPNYFIQEETDEKEINRQVSNKDPLATVEVKGLPPNQGQLYISALRDIFICCSTNMNVYFEEGRALIEFLRSNKAEVIGILPAVYLAVKMRQLRMPLELQVYSKEEGSRKLDQLRCLRDQKCDKERVLRSNRVSVQVLQHCHSIKQVPLPSLRTLTIRLFVTAVVECGHFWAQYREPETQMSIAFIDETINMHQGKNLKSLTTKPAKGMVVLAPYIDDPENRGPLIYYENADSLIYYRAKIEDIYSVGVKVFYIDYGNRMVLPDICFLKEIDVTKTPDLLNIPAQAFECTLCEIKPSVIKDPNGMWTDEAKAWFSNRVSGQELVARVYSVVQSIVRLELIVLDSSNVEISVNQQLIQHNFAEPAEERYASKKNHDMRVKLEMSESCEHDIEEQDSEFVHLTMEEVSQVSSIGHPTQKIKLFGPFSPLESTYKGVTRLASFRRIRIDRDSVNSVVLDCEPQDKHTRLLVSSYVSLSSDGSTINARNTTLMPNIHGLLAFVLLIFSPSAEFRTDPSRRLYTGAVCGLGCDEEGKSLYFDHDTELTLETRFGYEDIVLINGIRIGINLLLGKGKRPLPVDKRDIQERVKNHMLKLLSRHRESVEPKEYRPKYRWKQLGEEHLLRPEMVDSLSDCPHVLPLHNAVDLDEDTIQEKLRKHILELHSKLKSTHSSQTEVNKCMLCGVTAASLQELKAHLQDINHRSREEKLFEE